MNRIGEDSEIRTLVESALAEDCARQDATSIALVPVEATANGSIVARERGILSGIACAEVAFKLCAPEMTQEWFSANGDEVTPGDVVMKCHGPARALLAAERTALNLLQQLSGVATATRNMQELAGSVRVLDTRKTAFGLRDLQKAAVRDGGGDNQRRDLSDELLIKENHFALC